MTISLTLTAETLPGKESDRHLLTSTALLSENNPRERRPLEACLARMPFRPGPLRLPEEMGSGTEERLDALTLSAHLFLPRLSSMLRQMPGSVPGTADGETSQENPCPEECCEFSRVLPKEMVKS